MKTVIFTVVSLFFSFNASAECSAFCVNSSNTTKEITLVKAATADGLFRLCQGAQRKLLQQSNNDDEQILQPSLPLKVATAENSCGDNETENVSLHSFDDLSDDSSQVESL